MTEAPKTFRVGHLLAVASVVFACGGEAAPHDQGLVVMDAAPADAGTADALADAHGVADVGADAAVADTMPADAAVVGEAVTVVVTDPETQGPVRDAQVVFHSSDGSFLSVVLTSTSGVATGAVPTGGMVTIIDDAEATWTAQTWVALLPPETLRVFRRTQDPPEDPTIGSMTVNFEPSKYTTITLSAGRTSNTSSALVRRLTITQSMLQPANTINLVALARGSDGHPEAYSFLTDVAVTSTVVMMPAWQTDLGSVDVTWRNVPAVASRLDFESALKVGDVDYPLHERAVVKVPQAMQTSAIFYPPNAANGLLYVGTLFDATGFRQSTRSLNFDTVPSQIRIDALQDSLPFIDTASVSYTQFNRPSFFVRPTGAVDVIEATLNYPAQKGPQRHRWIVVGPPSAAELKVPELPPLTAALHEPFNGGRNGHAVEIIDYDEVADYRALRRTAPERNASFAYKRSVMRFERR